MKYCAQCGKPLEDDVAFCYYCGEPCLVQKPSENSLDVCVESAEDKETVTSQLDDSKTSTSKVPLWWMLLIGCVILWLAVPFVAINLLTLGDQPTALELVLDDVRYFGELTETAAFWSAIISGVGILFCCLLTIVSEYTTARVVAAITEIFMIFAILEGTKWADDLQGLFEFLGVGFWGIFVMLLVIVFSNPDETD